MQISAILPVSPPAASAISDAAPAHKVFTPAPPLRPNVQDYVDIDRTLIELRGGT